MLKQSGPPLPGRLDRTRTSGSTIAKGAIEGDKIKLLVEQDGRTLKFDLVLAAGRMTGDVEMGRDGRTMQAKIDVTRAK